MFFTRLLYFLTCILMPYSLLSMEVKIFNVGQGNCTVITYPGQPSLLVDAGSDQLPQQKSSDLISSISSYLQQHSSHGICILISHPEKDHADWIQKIIGNLPGLVQNITVGGNKESYSKFLPSEWISSLFDSTHITNHHPSHLPSYCSIWHAGYNQPKTNNQSLIICAEDTNFRVILPGDSGSTTFNQQTIVPSNKPTYFVANHHGSQKEGANNPTILQALGPKAIIISSGMHGRYHHPTFDALSAFAQITQPTQNQYYINGETAPNLIGNSQTQAIINYSSNFSVYRTSHPIFTTNSMGNITINSQGLTTTQTSNNAVETLHKSYFTDFNFNTIVRLFLSKTNINDSHIQQLRYLPLALTYFDLQNNYITAHSIAQLIALLQHRQSQQIAHPLLIKTSGNNIGTLERVKPVIQGSCAAQQLPSSIKISWNQPLAWMATTINALQYDPTQENPSPSEETVRSNLQQLSSGTRISSPSTWDFSDIFVHLPASTWWYNYSSDSQCNFTIPDIFAAWRAKNTNTFLFTSNRTSYVVDSTIFQLQGTAPCGITQNYENCAHISTRFATGDGLQNADNLQGAQDHTCQFEFAQPISNDGIAILTVENQNKLNIWKKENSAWLLKRTYNYSKPIQYAGFNDLNHSVLVKFVDNTSEYLPLELKAIHK
ncbi:MAG: hypothetical protein AMXMBFR12_00060 [Candidatus Babeliales bacterium]